MKKLLYGHLIKLDISEEKINQKAILQNLQNYLHTHTQIENTPVHGHTQNLTSSLKHKDTPEEIVKYEINRASQTCRKIWKDFLHVGSKLQKRAR